MIFEMRHNVEGGKILNNLLMFIQAQIKQEFGGFCDNHINLADYSIKYYKKYWILPQSTCKLYG